MIPHQYIDRRTLLPCTEKILLDNVISFIYSKKREDPTFLTRILASRRMSSLFAFLNYDMYLSRRITGINRFLRMCRVDLSECVDPPELLNTPKKIFERRIRYWECRPMPTDEDLIVSPADARMLLGSLQNGSGLFLKNKFFHLDELLGEKPWTARFSCADFALFRLTPDKYHYNHFPVSGQIVDFYEIPGVYHSCNPSAVVALMTPYSKNKRVVTIIDTDVPGGTGAGLVAMIEVVALMIGRVDQRYSRVEYENPQAVAIGMCAHRGCPRVSMSPGAARTCCCSNPVACDSTASSLRT